jgi:hypothetical protein
MCPRHNKQCKYYSNHKFFSDEFSDDSSSSISSVSDSDDGKQVASASITEPPKVGDPSILYIDDGSGFEPSYEGQSVDVLLSEASGNEEFLQLAN